MIDKTVAVILGGGVGSRLYPLTAHRSKPAVPLVGKYRLIDIPISNCLNSKIRKIFVLTMFNSASLNKHIKNTYHFDHFSSGFVNILAAEQTRESTDWFQGTADAVRKSLSRLEPIEHDYVLILSGDQLYNFDFEEILASHIEQKADLTIATIPVQEKDTSGFGIMKVEADGTISDFIEKPGQAVIQDWKSILPEKYTTEGKEYLASMGIYVFSKSSLKKLFDENIESNDFGKEIIPYAVESDQYKVIAYKYDGYWEDIGTIRSYLEANLYLTEYLPDFHLYDNTKKIYTHARMLAPSKIFGTKINHGLLCEGCIIHAEEISRCIIGIRSRIGTGAIIRDSIILGNDYYQTVNDMKELPDNKLFGIGNNCFIQNAIIDRNARIGNDVKIIGDLSLEDIDTEAYCIREGIVVVKKNAFIPAGSLIGKA